jgi:hypothetical protein
MAVPVEEAARSREVPLKARTTKPLDHSSPLWRAWRMRGTWRRTSHPKKRTKRP